MRLIMQGVFGGRLPIEGSAPCSSIWIVSPRCPRSMPYRMRRLMVFVIADFRTMKTGFQMPNKCRGNPSSDGSPREPNGHPGRFGLESMTSATCRIQSELGPIRCTRNQMIAICP